LDGTLLVIKRSRLGFLGYALASALIHVHAHQRIQLIRSDRVLDDEEAVVS
jgi:hypothetical protein